LVTTNLNEDVLEQVLILREAAALFSELTTHPVIQEVLAENGKTATGGFLCVASEQGIPFLIAHIGMSDASKAQDRLMFSQEKAMRLAQHRAHHLSRESENKELQRYPGAVRALDVLLSFSGLPGHLDELFMIILGVRLNRIPRRAARALLATYLNDYARREVVESFLSR
jgi:hypothetical protein